MDEAIARVREGYAMVVAANDIAVATQGFGDAMQRFRGEVPTAPAPQKSKLPSPDKKGRSARRV